MCRVVAYLGERLPLRVLLFDSDSSLARQAYDPAMLHFLNLAGSGFAAWDRDSRNPEVPFVYKDTALPTYDRNLMRLGQKIYADCVVAHVRADNYFGSQAPRVNTQNLHPFLFGGVDIALAHNGTLAGFNTIKYDLLRHIHPHVGAQIEGTTDSEWIYALFVSRWLDAGAEPSAESLAAAVVETLELIRRVRDDNSVATVSGANLFVSNGRCLVATRFEFDFGRAPVPLHPSHLDYHSLWYTAGHGYGEHDGEWRMRGGIESADSVLLASEPLTRDTSRWVEVPEYSVVVVERSEDGISLTTTDLDA